jgi:hypothetical protein
LFLLFFFLLVANLLIFSSSSLQSIITIFIGTSWSYLRIFFCCKQMSSALLLLLLVSTTTKSYESLKIFNQIKRWILWGFVFTRARFTCIGLRKIYALFLCGCYRRCQATLFHKFLRTTRGLEWDFANFYFTFFEILSRQRFQSRKF